MTRNDAERWLAEADAFPAGTPTDFYDEELAATAHTDARAILAYVRRQIEEASSAP